MGLVAPAMTAAAVLSAPESAPNAPQAVRLMRELASDRSAVEALVLAAFGPGRFAKTAERLREAARMTAGFVARESEPGAEQVIGSVRLWSVTVDETPAVFLGPIAVDASSRKGGLGADLVAACIEEARATQTGGVLLVGDPAYFERFGFVAAPQAKLLGPVDQRRVMWLPVTVEQAVGVVRPVG